MSGFEYQEETNIDSERGMMANAFVRQVYEIAVREGCDLPVTLLIAIMKAFDQQIESRFRPAARADARSEFTRCGAINRTASLAMGPGIGRSIRLSCFSGCGAVANHGRFCFDHRRAP